MKLPFKLNKARKLSDEDIRRIIELAKFGETESEIARIMGVCRSAIRHHRYKHFYPEKFAQMEALKVIRNKNYRKYNPKHPKERIERLRGEFGRKKVAVARQKIKDKWQKENHDKFLEQRRKYRNKNRDRINANWRRRYHALKVNLH